MAHDSPNPNLPARLNAPHAAPAPAPSPTPAPLPAHSGQKRYRGRHDGWTAARRGVFLESLTQTGCVKDACAAAGLSAASAHYAKNRMPDFAAAWDAALEAWEAAGGARATNPLIPSYRERHDGWTGARTRTFLATLRQTGCVTDAARVTGVSTTSGYRLRKQDAVFRAAWDAALADARRGLLAVAYERAVVGRETVIIREGKEVERRITPSDAMLALLIKQGDLSRDLNGDLNGNLNSNGNPAKQSEEEENPHTGALREKLSAKLDLMRERLLARDKELQKVTICLKTGEGLSPDVIAAVQDFAAKGHVWHPGSGDEYAHWNGGIETNTFKG